MRPRATARTCWFPSRPRWARGGAYVPPGPEQQEPIERFTPERHPSYCNYRYLLEMLSAGVLPTELVGKVVAWRRSHGGELLAGTRFEQQMDDWPALHYARGLLETDDVDHYLLLMYGHWAHHCSQGTLSSYEQVRIEPDEFGTRRMVAGQVVPCQVMVPTMLRWGLLYEEREADVLWLCRAIPRRWLAPGEQVALRGVPTRFGKVSFSLRVAESGSVLVKLRLPDRGCTAEIRLRLRTPGGGADSVRERRRPAGARRGRRGVPTGRPQGQGQAGGRVVLKMRGHGARVRLLTSGV